MPKPKGSPKTGGRAKGSVNKNTADKIRFNRNLHDRLMAHGCDIDKEIARCIETNNYEMVKAIQGLYPYIQPKWKEAELPIPITDDEYDDEDTESILEALQ
jgi:hypothetical protein